MAQGLDLKAWNSDKRPSMESKAAETGKKARGVGSRRIFPPQFKLQVLDSYRRDLDCRGNQRATARKYNIHRRQIQKWLQCEHNLRTTVEETARHDPLEPRPRKRSASEDTPDPTFSQSATAFARLPDAPRPKENCPETKLDSFDDSKLEAQNLKRVAQKLYPSVQPREKLAHPTDGQKFFGGDVAYAFRPPPSPPDTRDDNFNKLTPTDDGPLDLKSRAREEALPEERPPPGAAAPSPDRRPAKLSIGAAPPGAALRPLPQECGGERAEGGAEGGAERGAEAEEGAGAGAGGSSGKKPKREILSRFEWSKSFSPKRKWMEESMQEMRGEGREAHSLPIKQRVKLDLRGGPEGGRGGAVSNFSIERLCSKETRREGEWCGRPPSGGVAVGAAGLPLKEERVSDGEEAEVDILSTTPVEKKSFELSGYGFGKRRSFSVQFKLTVLDAFYNDKDCNKNQRATARKFNINRRQVQKWLSQESDLRSEGSVKNGKYLQRQRLGGEPRDGEGCARCPQHCLRRREVEEGFERTIEVNVEQCSDHECLSRGGPRGRGGGADFYGKGLFPSELKAGSFYHNYLFPENNNLIYHDSLLGWPGFSPGALPVPNFQYLSTWHHSFDFCPENQKIY